MKTGKKCWVIFMVFFLFFVFSCQVKNSSNDDNPQPQVDKKYQIRVKATVTNTGARLTRFVVVIPLAQTNQYQSVENVNLSSGTSLNIPQTDDKYIRWIYTTSAPLPGQEKECYYDFDVTLHPFNFNFAQATPIVSYDTKSTNYLWYTGASGNLVVPTNSTIISIGKNLWAQSTDIIDYARRCYEYVAKTYKYKNPNTGLHDLKDILAAGGGDCGNLSSIYISLLRYKGIPARHIVTLRPDASAHVWADFYLQNYGWVPVDVTYKNSTPNGDYFGKYDGNGIVFDKEVWLRLDLGNNNKTYCPLLQTFSWWYWASSGVNKVTSSYNLTSRRIN